MSDQVSTQDAKTPGVVIAAFVLSIVGFICLVPAIIGLILGIIGRKRAVLAGRGVGLATTAIIISIAWLVLAVVVGIISIANSGSSSSTSSAPSQVTVSSIPSPAASAPSSAMPTSSESSSSSTDSLVPQTAFLAQVRDSGDQDARDVISKKKDAALVSAGFSACKNIQVRGPLAGYGTFYASQEVPSGVAPWIAEAALEHLCPNLGVPATQIANYTSDFDGWVVQLAEELPFSMMLDDARDQGGVGKDSDTKNMMKNALMFCSVLDEAKPWEFFEAFDGMHPSGSTPMIVQYKGLINSAYFHLCPKVRYSPQQVAKKWLDRNLG